MRVTCTISTGDDDNGTTVEAVLEDEQTCCPEVLSDWLRHAGDHVLRLFTQAVKVDDA